MQTVGFTASVPSGMHLRMRAIPTTRSLVCRASTRSNPQWFTTGAASLLMLANTAAAYADDQLEVLRSRYDDLAARGSSVVTDASSAFPTIDLDIASNPIVVGAAVTGLALAGVITLFTRGPDKVTNVSAQQAYETLGAEENSVFLDIRPKAEVGKSGAPDLKELSKKVNSLPYSQVDKEGNLLTDDSAFVAKFMKMNAFDEDSIVVLMDSDGTLAPRAAAALVSAEVPFQRILVIQQGAEGPKGWKASELPWKVPGPVFSLPSLGSLQIPSIDGVAESYRQNPTLLNGVLALGAIAGAAGFVISEFEVLMEVAGAFAAGQFLVKNLLLAKDREKTFAALKEFFQEKVGAADASEDLRRLAVAILESPDAESAARRLDAAAGSQEEAPVQVKEAKEWISNWRAKQGGGSEGETKVVGLEEAPQPSEEGKKLVVLVEEREVVSVGV